MSLAIRRLGGLLTPTIATIRTERTTEARCRLGFSNTAGIAATCEILSLSLGPLDLNLPGLRVELDNCANGPVTVDIDAIQGGGPLGDLLCGLSLAGGAGGLSTAVQRLLFLIS